MCLACNINLVGRFATKLCFSLFLKDFFCLVLAGLVGDAMQELKEVESMLIDENSLVSRAL